MTLSRKVIRSLRKKLSFNLVTAVLTGITVTVLIGALTTADTLQYKTEDIFGILNVEHAQFLPVRTIDEEDLEYYQDSYDLILEPQYCEDITDGDDTVRVFASNSKINLTWIFEMASGQQPEVNASQVQDGEVYICRKYAEAHNLNSGDTMNIGSTELEIAGFALRPDYLNTLKDYTESIGDYEHFSTAIVSMNTYEDVFGEEAAPAYYSVVYNDESAINAFRADLYDAYTPLEYFNSDANSRISLVKGEVPMLRGEFSTYSMILFTLVVIIVAFMLSRIITAEGRNIGTLKALGYRKKELITHYILYALMPTASGCIIGSIGSIPFSGAFSAFFFNDLDSFPYDVSTNPLYIFLAALIPIVLNSSVTAIVTSRLLNKEAIVLMKKADTAHKINHAFNGSSLRFRTLYTMRVLLGNPVRTLVFIIGTTVACMIILLGGICQDSQKNVIDHVLPDLMGDARYETGLNSFHTGQVENGQTLIDVMFEVEGDPVAFNLVGYDEDNTLLERETLSGEETVYGEYYLTSCAANYYGIEPGDEFTFVHRITGQKTTVTIADIIYNNGLRLLITSKENAADIVGVSPDEYNNILSVVPVDVPEQDIYKIADFDTYKDSFEQMMATTKVVYAVLLIVGIIVCVLIVNLLSGMIIDENSRNISMLKVLGYRGNEIRDVILRMNHFLLPCCFLLSIPLTAYMAKILMADSVSTSGIWIDVVIKPGTLLVYFAVVLAAYLISLFLSSHKLDRVDMAQSLKQED